MSDGRSIILLGTVLLFSSLVAVEGNYCNVNCDGIPHTMCTSTMQEGGGPQCSGYENGLTDPQKQLILDLHNMFRQRIAQGKENRGKPGPQPPASNMFQLTWNEEIAAIAQRLADQCTIRGHDQCRNGLDGEYVGQNIAGCSGSSSTGCANLDRASKLANFVKSWYDEVLQANGENANAFVSDGTGHYTQLVWAQTTEVGCGASYRCDGYSYTYKLVCNYKPGGNYGGQPVYSIGEACSHCLMGSSCSTTWEGLCED